MGGWKANPHTDYLEWTEGVYDIIEAPLDYRPGLSEGLEFFLPEYVPIITDKVAKCLATGDRFSMECQVKTTTGKMLWTEVRGLAPILEEKRSYVLGTFQDITERKRAEEALRESEEKYRLLVESANEGIVLTQEGKIKYVNPRAVEFAGYSQEEMMEQSMLQFFHPDDRERLMRLYLMKLAGENVPPTSSWRIVDKQGNVRWVQSRSTVLTWEGKRCLLSFLTDITQQKEAEEALRESEARFREMSDLLPQAVYESDGQGNLTYVNRCAFDLFGYAREDFEEGLNVFQMLVPEERDRAATAIRAALTGDPQGIDRNYRALRKDGSSFPVEIYSSPIVHKGETVGLRGIIVDMTEHENAAVERERLQAQLLQAQKMEAVGTLAGGIAHDFNNLLMGIQGRASLMLADMDPSNPCFEHLRGIEEYVRSAADLTKQLLGFARG